MSHYVNNVGHHRIIDSTKIWTCIYKIIWHIHQAIRYPWKFTQTRLNSFFPSAWGNKIPSTTSCTLALPQLPSKGKDEYFLQGLLHRYLISIVNVYNAGWKEIFYEPTSNITRKGISILKGRIYHQTGIFHLLLYKKIEKSPHWTY